MDPIVLGDFSVNLDEALGFQNQRVADPLLESGINELVRHS